MSTTVVEEYRKVRARQMRGALKGHRYHRPAACALRVARDEVALRAAERDDRVRFRWEEDWEYAPESGIEEYDQEERVMLAAGSWEALGCIAEVPRKCGHCGTVLGDDPSRDDYWEQGASLWGIVVDVDDREDYRREVEREPANEVGALEEVTA